MIITPRASAPDTYLAYASPSDLPNKQKTDKQVGQSASPSAKTADATSSSPVQQSVQGTSSRSDSLTLSEEAKARLREDQQSKQGATERLKDQMLSKRQQELSKGNKTNEQVKQEQIQATKDEIKKVKEALQKLQHKEGEMVEKQRDQLNLALVQLNTQLLELMRS
ncbi:hypothetical protein [Motilimonas eburnea]|uniref:hypothetical protein n=1 Tax=Motilimonas eburnea TaxID=1737488 RepID=UPI001E314A5B|nr:hypothetical protein [Motilimonas eburnea]MCE2573280.1 hypothetical protein [Motilimonas eburnea]